MTDTSNTRAFPTRDLRGIYTWLRERKAAALRRAPSGTSDELEKIAQGLEAVRKKLEAQLEAARQGVLGAEDDPPVTDRQLDYPFTRGISVINDGIAYGEIIVEKRIAASDVPPKDLRVRRTKTGRIEFWPSAKGPTP